MAHNILIIYVDTRGTTRVNREGQERRFVGGSGFILDQSFGFASAPVLGQGD